MLSAAQRDRLVLKGEKIEVQVAERQRRMFHADYMDPMKNMARLTQRVEQRNALVVHPWKTLKVHEKIAGCLR